MTLSNLIAAAYLKSTGEVSTLTTSDDDWTKLLQIANFYIQNWESEPGVNWRSLYAVTSLADTVSATDTFALGTTIRQVSTQEGDPIRIIHTDTTKYTDYDLIDPERLKEYNTGNYCAVEGSNLVFNAAFTATSPEFGGTIKVPGYLYASTFADDATGSETVPVDNPNWLALMMAAEYVRTDVTRGYQYPNLIAEANDLMIKMKQENSAQVTRTYKQAAPTPNGATW